MLKCLLLSYKLLDYGHLKVILHALYVGCLTYAYFCYSWDQRQLCKNMVLDTQEDALKAGYLPTEMYNWGLILKRVN